VEALYQMYDPAVLRAFAPDIWNGSDAQADLFQSVAEISFPVLLDCGDLTAGDQYDTGRHTVFVIDGEGIVRYRGPVDEEPIIAALDQAVEDLGGVGVGDLPAAGALLGANYPNPFNPSTRIPYQVPGERSASVRLEVLDLRGRVVRTLVDGMVPAGSHLAIFDGRDRAGEGLPSGSYLARLTVDGRRSSRTMTLLK
jgi:hypothetical protein